jgi:hypothetical protein
MPTRNVLRVSLPLTLTLATTLPAATLAHLLPSGGPDRFDYAIGRGSNGTVAGHSHEFSSVVPVIWQKPEAAYASPAALALPIGSQGGEARWIAPDASLVAGFAALPVSGRDDINSVPVLWTRGAGGAYTASILTRLSGTVSETVIHGGNASGSHLVGQSGHTPVAALWRGAPLTGYTVQALPLPGGALGESSALAISANGGRAIGRYESVDGTQSVVWTEGSPAYSALRLAPLPGGSQTFVETLSSNGALAAGAAETGGALRPAVWNTGAGSVTLFETLGGLDSTILNVAENSAWFGGRATDPGSFAGVAVLWDQGGRIHSLITLASAAGASFPGFTPESVTGVHHVTNDVYTIVGTGVSIGSGSTRGFVLENLTLQTPSAPTPGPTPPSPDPELEPEPGTPPGNPGGVFLNRQRPASPSSGKFAEPKGPARILGTNRRD